MLRTNSSLKATANLIRYCCWCQRAHLKMLQNFKTHDCRKLFLFSPEHHQSRFPSEVIDFRRGHKEVQRVKRREEKPWKVNKHKLLLSVFLLWQSRVNEALSALPTAAGKEGMPASSPSRYQASCTPIIPASPLILRGNINTLMAASSLQAVFTNTGCAMVAPGACKGLISN